MESKDFYRDFLSSKNSEQTTERNEICPEEKSPEKTLDIKSSNTENVRSSLSPTTSAKSRRNSPRDIPITKSSSLQIPKAAYQNADDNGYISDSCDLGELVKVVREAAIEIKQLCNDQDIHYHGKKTNKSNKRFLKIPGHVKKPREPTDPSGVPYPAAMVDINRQQNLPSQKHVGKNHEVIACTKESVGVKQTRIPNIYFKAEPWDGDCEYLNDNTMSGSTVSQRATERLVTSPGIGNTVKTNRPIPLITISTVPLERSPTFCRPASVDKLSITISPQNGAKTKNKRRNKTRKLRKSKETNDTTVDLSDGAQSNTVLKQTFHSQYYRNNDQFSCISENFNSPLPRNATESVDGLFPDITTWPTATGRSMNSIRLPPIRARVCKDNSDGVVEENCLDSLDKDLKRILETPGNS